LEFGEISMQPTLSLHEDTLSSDARPAPLPARPRMIFVAHGSVTIAGQTLADNEAWGGEGEAAIMPGPHGATCWRWELAAARTDAIARGPGVSSHEKLSALLATLPDGDLLLRGDSVSFPPGGCAYLHRHQGPGIRCVFEGAIRIDTHGRSTSYGPGGAWYESGPDPVFAQGSADRPTRFIRMMVLPRALLGKSSIQYLNPEDAGKPKVQQYKLYLDAPIAFAPARA
jgi:hypothetical protein